MSKTNKIDSLQYFYENSDTLKGLEIEKISSGTKYFVFEEEVGKSKVVILSKAGAPRRALEMRNYKDYKVTGYSASPDFKEGDRIAMKSDSTIQSVIKRATYKGYQLENGAVIDYVNQGVLMALKEPEVVESKATKTMREIGVATATTNDKPVGNKEGKFMTNVKELVGQNKDNALLVAQVTTGKALNKTVLNVLKPKLPMMVRGYADSPVAAPVIANAAALAIRQYAPNNIRANQAADLMLKAAAFQMAEAFDIDSLIEDVLGSFVLPGEEKEQESAK